MSFQIILETTSLPNVLVKMICDYNNLRPVAHDFSVSYLQKRLGGYIVKLLNFDAVVDGMIEWFERLVQLIAERTSNLSIDESVAISKKWDELSEMFSEMFPMVYYLYNRNFDDFMSYNEEARDFVMPALIRFVKGCAWVSPTDPIPK